MTATLTATNKERILAALRGYQSSLSDYVENQHQVSMGVERYRRVAHGVEPLLEQLDRRALASLAGTKERVEREHRHATWLLVGTGILVALARNNATNSS